MVGSVLQQEEASFDELYVQSLERKAKLQRRMQQHGLRGLAEVRRRTVLFWRGTLF